MCAESNETYLEMESKPKSRGDNLEVLNVEKSLSIKSWKLWASVGGGGNIYIYLGTSLGEGNGTPLQYSCLENPMNGGAW